MAWTSRFTADIDFLVHPTLPNTEREELIRNKESAGRPQDLADADALRKRRK
jgi:hypothetical protein